MPIRFDIATVADIRFGAGRVGEVPSALACHGVRHALVVTGATTSRADQVRRAMAENGVTSDVFAVPTEPTIELVRARRWPRRSTAATTASSGTAAAAPWTWPRRSPRSPPRAPIRWNTWR